MRAAALQDAICQSDERRNLPKICKFHLKSMTGKAPDPVPVDRIRANACQCPPNAGEIL